jgi:cell division protein FtsL
VRARAVRRGIAIASIAIVLALAFVWTRVRVIQVGYEATKLNRQVRDLIEQSNELQVKIAKLKAPERLERLASEHFHMRLPQGDEIVFLARTEDRGPEDE